MEYIDSLSPLDGRYHQQVDSLREFFSERAFFHYRALVEITYLIAFLKTTHATEITANESEKLLKIADISIQDFGEIKTFEAATHHDVKALEYFLKDKIKNTMLHPFIHFGLTSEDTNNIAYPLMVSDALEQILLPALQRVENNLTNFADRYQNAPMLARTHGQPASPTTFGKEMRVFQNRLIKKINKIKTHQLDAKLNGATGNYNALVAAFPNVDWIDFSQRFISSFNGDRLIQLQPNLLTTQIEPHDSLVELFDLIHQTNTILIDLCGDMWRYISEDWLQQNAVDGEVGSSTMPHKVNPIHFENAEGNLGLANTLLSFFSQKLPVSRLQRDLSDSTVMRNIGVAFGHCLLAYTSITDGLSRVSLNEMKCLQVLNENPQVITEAIQVILKREGVTDAYETLLELSRGKQISLKDIADFIRQLDLSAEVKEELLAITPETYLGLAGSLK